MPAWAQDYAKAEIYGGYQRIIDDQLTENITYGSAVAIDSYTRLNGVSASFEYNVKSWLGIVGEFGHGRSLLNLAGPVSSSDYKHNQTTYLFGPRIGFRSGRIRVFGHALFGGNTEHNWIALRSTGESIEWGGYSTEPALALGGGLDIPIGRRISIRPAQLDLLSIFSNDSHHHSGSTQYQFRYSAGMVISLGSGRPALQR